MVSRTVTPVEETHDHRARLTVLERGQDELKESVNNLAKTVNRFISESAKAPRPIPLKEMVATAAATLGLVAMILNLFDNRVGTSVDLALAKQRPSVAVYEYRLETLEKRFKDAK